MATHPKLAFAERSLKVAFQTVADWQTVIVRFRIENAWPAVRAGMSQLGMVGIAVGWGTVGGSELPPWESEMEVLNPDSASADGLTFEYRLRVRGISHRYIPHFVHHMSMQERGHGLVQEMSIVGSAPITDQHSIDEVDILPALADPTRYPGRWAEAGFDLVYARGKKQEFGVELELEGPLDQTALEKLHAMLGGFDLLLSSYGDEHGGLVDLIKSMGRKTPVFVASGGVLRAYARALPHDHRSSRDAIANMLIRAHHRVARIRKATITSSAAP